MRETARAVPALRSPSTRVSLDQRTPRFGEDADEFVPAERFQLHTDREAALQLGDEIRRLRTWNAPAAMKGCGRSSPFRIACSPWFLRRWEDVACTPSRLTSGPWLPSRPAILSISSTKMMPVCSTRPTASRATLSMSMSFCSSSWGSDTQRLWHFHPPPLGPSLEQPRQHVLQIDVDFLDRGAGDDLEGRETISRGRRARRSGGRAGRRAAARGSARGSAAVDRAAAASSSGAIGRGGGSRTSSSRSSAFCAAFARTSSSRSSRTMSTPSSTRSRTIDSTSRPT